MARIEKKPASDVVWLKPIEGMRGFAAFLVFFVHFNSQFGIYVENTRWLSAASQFLGDLGNAGVDLFFVISGFLIYGIILRKAPNYKTFVWRRIVRLYPVFLFVLSLYLIECWLVPGDSKIPAGPTAAIRFIVANLLMLPGILPITPIITVAWSLSYELLFYALLPLFAHVLGIRRWSPAKRASYFTIFIVAYLLGCKAGLCAHPRLMMFGAGILLYEAIYHSRLPRLSWKQLDWVAIVATLGSLVFVGMETIKTGSGAKMVVQLPFAVTPVLFIALSVLVFSALAHDGPLMKVFSIRWVRWFGDISYSYYLTHGLTLHVLGFLILATGFRTSLGPVAFVFLAIGCFALTCVGAAIVYEMIERPLSLANRRVTPDTNSQSQYEMYVTSRKRA